VFGNSPFRSLFRRPRPEGSWSLAHPLREPLRAIAQSFVFWPVAAFAAIMLASPKAGVELTPITKLALQATVVYPLIAGAAIALHFLLLRVGFRVASALPLVVPLAIEALWVATLLAFLARYAASMAGWL
jgi:hypothetical protein